MTIPADRRRSYLARQVGTLALAHVRVDSPMARVRAAAWHNATARAGVALPLFVVHDLGLLFTVPRGAGGWSLARPAASPRLAPGLASSLEAYGRLLERIASSEVVEKAATWRLRDELVAVIVSRVLTDAYHAWPHRGKRAGVEELPLDPTLYEGADPAAHLADFDLAPIASFLEVLAAKAWHVYTCVEQIDLDTLRLLGLFREGAGPGAEGAVDLADLFRALRSTAANDVVNFSLELLPSVLETKRASGAQAFAMDGYASIEREGNLDSLVLTELAYDEEVFYRKVLDDELFYYAHERQHEEERRLQYLLVDASASMRGAREVFARGLALTLVKKLLLEGDEVWLRFFDSRLHDLQRAGRSGSGWIPYFLGFRSERGRNYGKVFRQLTLELARVRREAGRRVVLYVITHGQCHLPVETVAQLKRHAYLYAVIILPSSEVTIDALSLFDKVQIVSAEALGSREGRRDRALGIVDDAAGGRSGGAGGGASPAGAPRARRATTPAGRPAGPGGARHA